tara:strand:- start:23 stop:157 length:135 start_codon:yes stop_codon:yes gene_type:complete
MSRELVSKASVMTEGRVVAVGQLVAEGAVPVVEWLGFVKRSRKR